MENQHRKIKGYRELTQEEIDLMNEIKGLGPMIESVINKLRAYGDNSNLCNDPGASVAPNDIDPCDHRWIAVGQTHLQQGLMALTRAVAKPDFF